MSHRSLATLPLLALFCAATPALQGCVVAAAGAGASAGYELTQQRSVNDQIKDTALQAEVTAAWRQYEPKLSENCSATVYDGRVLITGRVPNEQWHQIALKLAYQPKGVKQVYDEIQVGRGEAFLNSAGDGIITTKLKGALLADRGVRSANYEVTTVEGIVYIMGVARSKAEEGDVVNQARNISGVRRVVSFTRVNRGGPAEPTPATAGAPPPPPPPSTAPEPPPPPAPRQPPVQSTPLQ